MRSRATDGQDARLLSAGTASESRAFARPLQRSRGASRVAPVAEHGDDRVAGVSGGEEGGRRQEGPKGRRKAFGPGSLFRAWPYANGIATIFNPETSSKSFGFDVSKLQSR